MNLNSFLCKYCDVGHKGYVTIFDLVLYSILCILIGFILSIILYGYYIMYSQYPDYMSMSAFNDISLVISISISVLLGVILLFKISDIKVAVCPLKKEEDNSDNFRKY